MVKTDEEIEKLKRSSKLADDCYNYIICQIKIGMTEIEIANLMDNYMLSNGATKLAFETIVGSGVNSSQIHSTPTDRKIEYGDLIQLDFGCVVDDYCSDMSRVLFVGEAKEEYKKIYDIVLEAQLAGFKDIKPGITAKDADLISRNIISSKGYDFKHAVGHGVGKEVHEDPIISPKNDKDVLENNLVFTIEPGIYIENQFGIRIEDTVMLKDGKVISLNNITKEIVVIKG